MVMKTKKLILVNLLIITWIGAGAFALEFEDSIDLGITFTSLPEESPFQSPITLENTFGTPDPIQTPFLKTPEVQRFIEEFQEQNSRFIKALIDPQRQLPYDAIYVTEDGKVEYQGGATTATEIGFWLDYLTLVAKGDINVSNLSPQEALSRLKAALKNVRELQQDPKMNWNGLLFKYNFKTGTVFITIPLFSPPLNFSLFHIYNNKPNLTSYNLFAQLIEFRRVSSHGV